MLNTSSKSAYFKLIFAFFIFAALATYLFFPALTENQVTMAFYGDGWGTIGGIFDKVDNFRNQQSPWNMFTDLYLSRTTGAGISWLGFPTNWFWNVTDFLCSFFLSPENVYDFTIGLSWVLIGIAGYLLGVSLGLSFFFALGTGLTIAFCENFFARTVGHRTLAAYFMPVFVIAASVRLSKAYNLRNCLLVAILCWLNFQVNEYYGYFGIFVTSAICVAILLSKAGNSGFSRRWIGPTIAAGAVFLFLMIMSYPNLVLQRLFQVFMGGHVAAAEFSHDVSVFDHYALSNPWLLFSPRLSFLEWISPPAVMKGEKPGEATFSIGILVPMFVLLSCVIHGLLKKYRRSQESRRLLSIVSILSAGLLLAFCLGISSIHGLSLVPLTQKFGPMFRVSARSFIYMNIILIALFWACLYSFWHLDLTFLRSHMVRIYSQSALRFTLFGIAVIGLLEVRGGTLGHLFERPRMMQLPDMSPYAELEKRPAGVLIELPFRYYGSNQPEDEYEYFLHRTVHKKTLLNGLPFSRTFWAAHRRLAVYRDFNQIDRDKVEVLRRLGIRYVAITKALIETVKYEDLATLDKVAENPMVVIYEIDRPADFDIQRIRDYIWPLEESLGLDRLRVPGNVPVQVQYHTKDELSLVTTAENGAEFLLSSTHVALEPGSYALQLELGPNTEALNLEIRLTAPEVGEIKVGPLEQGQLVFDLKVSADVQVHFLANSPLRLQLHALRFQRKSPMTFSSNFLTNRFTDRQ